MIEEESKELDRTAEFVNCADGRVLALPNLHDETTIRVEDAAHVAIVDEGLKQDGVKTVWKCQLAQLHHDIMMFFSRFRKILTTDNY
jgi:hypothetical protein